MQFARRDGRVEGPVAADLALTSQDREPPSIQGPSLRDRLLGLPMERLLTHWRQARGSAPIPRRTEIDPLAFADALDRVWIFRLDPDGEFRCVLAGERMIGAWGRPIRDRTPGMIFGPASGRDITPAWSFLLAQPAAMLVKHPSWEDGGRATSLVLPLADAAGRPRQILGMTSGDIGSGEYWMTHGRRTCYDTATLSPIRFGEAPHRLH